MVKPWIPVPGVVERGYGVASGTAADSPYPRGTIEMQTPFFRALGLDLADYFPGTLNVSIAPNTFRMAAPEFTFRGVPWFPDIPPEDFSFSRCRLVAGSPAVDGLVYYPHPETKTRHEQSTSTLEILAPHVPGIRPGDAVTLELDPREIEIIY